MDNEDENTETNYNESNENELSYFITTNDNHNKNVQVDVNMVHKSNAVESIINCNTKTSTDIYALEYLSQEIFLGAQTTQTIH